MIARRSLVCAFVAAAFSAFPCFAQQQSKVWRVGFLTYRDPGFVAGPFRQGMRELGYIEGRNLLIEWRSAEAEIERLPELAAELVRLKVDVLVTQGTPASQAARKATSAIPIVMSGVGDPVGTGLVKSLARPGGNSTALTVITTDLTPKLLGMLLEVAPKIIRVAMLLNPFNDSNPLMLKNLQAAAQALELKIQPVEVSTRQEIASAFAAMAREDIGGVFVAQDAFLVEHRDLIAELAMKQRLPSISTSRRFVEAGVLMSYGHDVTENPRRAATYVDKILKGAKPGDIPVEQPATFELFINSRTATALGIKLPQSILARATKVIE